MGVPSKAISPMLLEAFAPEPSEIQRSMSEQVSS